MKWAKVPLAVATDGRLGLADLRVLIYLLAHADKRDGSCFPSRKRIADDCGMTETSVSRSTRRLAQFGHLEKVSGSGRGHKTAYIIASIKGISVDTLSSEKGDTQDTLSGEKGITRVTQRVSQVTPSTDALPIDELTIELTSNTNTVNSCDPDQPDPFEVFWKSYPRKVAKANARKAWPKARQHLDAILADLDRRKASGWLDRPQFIPHPATYLNGKRWDDEPEEQRSATRSKSRTDHHAEISGLIWSDFDKFHSSPAGGLDGGAVQSADRDLRRQVDAAVLFAPRPGAREGGVVAGACRARRR